MPPFGGPVTPAGVPPMASQKPQQGPQRREAAGMPAEKRARQGREMLLHVRIVMTYAVAEA